MSLTINLSKIHIRDGRIIKVAIRARDILITVIRPKSLSITNFEVIVKNDYSTFLDINLLTGRTHQIRLHFASILHPLLGDNLYGNGKNKDTLCLDCYYLEFIHPISHKLCIINKD